MRRTRSEVACVLSGMSVLLCTGCGVAKTMERRHLQVDRVARWTIDKDALDKLSMDEIATRAGHIVDAATTALDGSKEPFTPAQLEWRKARDFANETKAKVDAIRPDAELSEKADLLTQAKERYSLAQQAVESAGVAEAQTRKDIVYSNYFRLHGGAATIRPYIIARDENDRRLLKTSTDTSFYAEVDFLRRTAWIEPEAIAKELENPDDWSRLVPQDYEIRLGFINQQRIRSDGSTDSTPFETSSETAGGDWYAEGTLGWVMGTQNISRDPEDRNVDIPRGTWGLDLDAGFQTDRNGFNTTGYYMIGPGTAWSIPITIGDHKRMATLAASVMFGIHEYPRVDKDLRIYSADAILPFNRLGSLGIKIDFTVPLTNGIEAVLQGRHFSPISRNDIADDWSLFVGVSMPIGRIVRDVLD